MSSQCVSPVWPDVEIKSGPISPKVAQKIAAVVLPEMGLFQIAQKVTNYLG